MALAKFLAKLKALPLAAKIALGLFAVYIADPAVGGAVAGPEVCPPASAGVSGSADGAAGATAGGAGGFSFVAS
jgi:hypothetical protein